MFTLTCLEKIEIKNLKPRKIKIYNNSTKNRIIAEMT